MTDPDSVEAQVEGALLGEYVEWHLRAQELCRQFYGNVAEDARIVVIALSRTVEALRRLAEVLGDWDEDAAVDEAFDEITARYRDPNA